MPVLAGAGAGEFVAEIVGRVEAISAGTHPLAPLPAAAAEEDSAPIGGFLDVPEASPAFLEALKSGLAPFAAQSDWAAEFGAFAR